MAIEPRETGADVEPFLVCRVQDQQLECALWTLEEGPQALALFVSREAAIHYKSGAGLDGDWIVIRPDRDDLLQILRHCRGAGVLYVVLDPDQLQAKRLFDITAVLENVARLSGPESGPRAGHAANG